ncbi:sigma-54 interaction domain-containing protein [Planctomycetota bacterium]
MADKDNQLPSQRVETILDSIADGVFTVNDHWRITSFNRAAEKITGIPCQDALDRPCCEVFQASICESECALRRTLETKKSVVNKAIYIVDAKGKRLPISISTALLKDKKGQIVGGVETFRDLSLVEELRKELAGRYTFSDILSRNRQMQHIFKMLPEVAVSDSTVLIEGESGTGKELIVRAIHNLSPRKEKPFVAINCGALPDNLLESELFGYKAGAFTDAKKDKPGRFSQAEGGTVFLDEIGDVSPALQVRLLRVLENRTFEPLGSTKSVTADVRIVAATNKSLDALVKTNSFRQDLYYRVNVMRIELPPLRQRKDDIPLLTDHFIDRFNRLRQKDIAGVSDQVMAVLLGHDYPGNVRELENVIEHAFVLCQGNLIELQYLPSYLRSNELEGISSFQSSATLAEAEKWVIFEALKQSNWNKTAAARNLGIHRSTLFRKMISLGIENPKKENLL